MKSWLKGGLIGGIIGLVTGILLSLVIGKIIFHDFPRLFYFIIFLLIIVPSVLFSLIGGIISIKLNRKIYWLKGGLLGIIIGLIGTGIIVFTCAPTIGCLFPDYVVFIFLSGFALNALIFPFLCNIIGIWCKFMGVIITLFEFFILGAIIGLIIGKFKNRNQEQIRAR